MGGMGRMIGIAGRGCGLALGLALLGCASPGLEFTGAVESEHRVDGGVYRVYVLDRRVQVIRTSRRTWPNAVRMHQNAVLAIRAATGCGLRKTKLRVNATVLTGTLDCAEGGRLPATSEA